jgi:two-component system, cell cycle response regulator DivK
MKRTILLIEDNEQNRYLTRFLLEGRDCVVVEAENGRLGIELASKQKFDLILLDIQLPIMDGYTVAKELRDNPATRNIPIIAVTSYAMMGDREKALSAGCDGYLEKPINPETFVSEIERFLPLT